MSCFDERMIALIEDSRSAGLLPCFVDKYDGDDLRFYGSTGHPLEDIHYTSP